VQLVLKDLLVSKVPKALKVLQVQLVLKELKAL